jgi:hypothetical protein
MSDQQGSSPYRGAFDELLDRSGLGARVVPIGPDACPEGYARLWKIEQECLRLEEAICESKGRRPQTLEVVDLRRNAERRLRDLIEARRSAEMLAYHEQLIADAWRTVWPWPRESSLALGLSQAPGSKAATPEAQDELLDGQVRDEAIRNAHREMRASAHSSPTKTLAKRYDLSERAIRGIVSRGRQATSPLPTGESVFSSASVRVPPSRSR